MVFDFHYADIDVESGSKWYKRTNWKPKDLKKLIDKSQKSIQDVPEGWPANFLENHDQPRSVTKYIRHSNYRNATGAKALGMLFFFLRGCPFIFQGEELGTQNFKRKDISEFNDVSSISNYKRMLDLGYSPNEAIKYVNLRSRDNGRTPFKWDNSVNCGFNVGHTPWLKLNNNPANLSVEDEEKDKNSVLNFYKEMIRLRSRPEYKELINGEYKKLKNLPESIVGYQRGNKFLVLVNLSSDKCMVELPVSEVVMSNYDTSRLLQGKHILNHIKLF